jgi:hypothetical protein
MRIHTNVTQANGSISVVLQPSFVGDMNDATDKALIAAFGDPEVNIAGSFTDPNNSQFTFQFPTTEMYVGITTELSSQTVQFCLALPNGAPYAPAPVQGALTCITPNPSAAAVAWQAVVVSRITQAMAALRANTLVPTISDVTV